MEVPSEDWFAPRLRCVVNDSTLVLIDMGMIRFLCSVDSQFGSPSGTAGYCRNPLFVLRLAASRHEP
jgi:hypothetical protein